MKKISIIRLILFLIIGTVLIYFLYQYLPIKRPSDTIIYPERRIEIENNIVKFKTKPGPPKYRETVESMGFVTPIITNDVLDILNSKNSSIKELVFYYPPYVTNWGIGTDYSYVMVGYYKNETFLIDKYENNKIYGSFNEIGDYTLFKNNTELEIITNYPYWYEKYCSNHYILVSSHYPPNFISYHLDEYCLNIKNSEEGIKELEVKIPSHYILNQELLDYMEESVKGFKTSKSFSFILTDRSILDEEGFLIQVNNEKNGIYVTQTNQNFEEFNTSLNYYGSILEDSFEKVSKEIFNNGFMWTYDSKWTEGKLLDTMWYCENYDLSILVQMNFNDVENYEELKNILNLLTEYLC